jgi:hypothetical protein
MATARDYLRNWMRWQRGRQGTGYDKLLLLANPFFVPFDLYLLRFPDGTEIPPHQDPVTGKRHYRLNIILKRPVLDASSFVPIPFLKRSGLSYSGQMCRCIR